MRVQRPEQLPAGDPARGSQFPPESSRADLPALAHRVQQGAGQDRPVRGRRQVGGAQGVLGPPLIQAQGPQLACQGQVAKTTGLQRHGQTIEIAGEVGGSEAGGEEQQGQQEAERVAVRRHQARSPLGAGQQARAVQGAGDPEQGAEGEGDGRAGQPGLHGAAHAPGPQLPPQSGEDEQGLHREPRIEEGERGSTRAPGDEQAQARHGQAEQRDRGAAAHPGRQSLGIQATRAGDERQLAAPGPEQEHAAQECHAEPGRCGQARRDRRQLQQHPEEAGHEREHGEGLLPAGRTAEQGPQRSQSIDPGQQAQGLGFRPPPPRQRRGDDAVSRGLHGGRGR